ncbi:MAG: hypothetical protein NC124_20500 [Clostridium sp.]|nr:hypothetical protein [Clostridium sp.]
MEEMKVWLMTLLFMFALLVNLSVLIKEIREIKKFKIKSNDRNIQAVVVGSLPHITGDVRPILQYVVKGVDKKYIYHYYYNQKKYPMGKEVILKISEDSGLAYDRTDLRKALVYHLLAVVVSFFFVGGCIFGIFFKR